MNSIGPIIGNMDRVGAPIGGGAPIQAPAPSGSGATTELAATAGSLNMLQIDTSVQFMLQSVGGGLANNQNLKMLIGLLILMALLQNPEDQGGGLQRTLDALDRLGGGSDGGAGGFTFTYQQSTSVTMLTEQYQSVGVMGGERGSGLDAIG